MHRTAAHKQHLQSVNVLQTLFTAFYVYLVFILPQVFVQCDAEKKGFLSRADLKIAVVMLFGYKPSKVNPETSRRRHLKGLQLVFDGRLLTKKNILKRYIYCIIMLVFTLQYFSCWQSETSIMMHAGSVPDCPGTREHTL